MEACVCTHLHPRYRTIPSKIASSLTGKAEGSEDSSERHQQTGDDDEHDMGEGDDEKN
jgi:hypothetical protein